MRLAEIRENLRTPFEEGLALRGSYRKGVFQRLVAGSYRIAPGVEEEAVPLYELLARKIVAQGDMLAKHFDFEYTSQDPYPSFKALQKAVEDQKKQGVKRPKVRVYSEPAGPEKDEGAQGHPLMSNDTNTLFRGVHDVIAHLYGKHPFSARGEYGAYLRHMRTLPRKVWPIMFAEVVGQTSYYYCYGDFPEQKAVILEDFNPEQVGLLASGSSLNEYFEVRSKVLVPKSGFSWKRFASARPELAKAIRAQKDFDPEEWESYDSKKDPSLSPTIRKKKR